MRIHLIDGTYELFRHFYGRPGVTAPDGQEVGAIVGVLHSLLGMLEDGVTHLAVATDHVIESFRNELWAGYKTGEGIDPVLLAQFHPLEDALRDLGIVVWPMIEFEADDGLAAGAWLATRDTRVEQVLLCTPDKDLSQCVAGRRVVQFDRMRREIRDEDGVVAKFGVRPESIPDWLALVGDTADGYPGLPGWGAKSAATLLARYRHLESIPADPAEWDVKVRGAARLSATLEADRELVLLFRRLATLRTDVELFRDVDQLRWQGPRLGFDATAARLGRPDLARRAGGAAVDAARMAGKPIATGPRQA